MGQKGCIGPRGYTSSVILNYKYFIYDNIQNRCDMINISLIENKNLPYVTKNLIYSINNIIIKSIQKCLLNIF